MNRRQSQPEPPQRAWAKYDERLRRLAALGIRVPELCELENTEGSLGTIHEPVLMPWERTEDNQTPLADLFREMAEKCPATYSLIHIDYRTRKVIAGPRLFVSVNWAPFEREARESIAASDYAQNGTAEISYWSDPTMPAGIPAILTTRVPVNELNIRDLEWLVSLFRAALRQAIENAPTTNEAPQIGTSIPRDQYDLLMSETFDQDLDRFGRWVGYAMTMEEIAEEDGHISERAVRDSIHKVCRALGAASTLERRDIRQRLMGAIECPAHGRDCDGAAITVIEFWGLVKLNGRVGTGKYRAQALEFACRQFEEAYRKVDRVFKMPIHQDLPLDASLPDRSTLPDREPLDPETGLTRGELLILRQALLGESLKAIADKLSRPQRQVQDIRDRAERKLLACVQARVRAILVSEVNQAISRLLSQARPL
jgi:hypothetical protein